MEEEVYEFINETQVIFKDEYTVLITYRSDTREINLNEELLIDKDTQFKVIPDKLMIDMCKSNDNFEEILLEAEDQILGEVAKQQIAYYIKHNV